MKKNLLLLLFIPLAALVFTGYTHAQERGSGVRESPNAAISQAVGNSIIHITYGRPAIKNRSYFTGGAELAPAGEPWRTGANEATAIIFSDDVIIAGQKVKAGTYSLYTIPGDNEWGVIISTNLAWGIPYESSKDVVRGSTSAVDRNAPFEEWFTISFNTLSEEKANLNLHWGTTKVSIPVEID